MIPQQELLMHETGEGHALERHAFGDIFTLLERGIGEASKFKSPTDCIHSYMLKKQESIAKRGNREIITYSLDSRTNFKARRVTQINRGKGAEAEWQEFTVKRMIAVWERDAHGKKNLVTFYPQSE